MNQKRAVFTYYLRAWKSINARKNSWKNQKWVFLGKGNQENGEVGIRYCHILIHKPFIIIWLLIVLLLLIALLLACTILISFSWEKKKRRGGREGGRKGGRKERGKGGRKEGRKREEEGSSKRRRIKEASSLRNVKMFYDWSCLSPAGLLSLTPRLVLNPKLGKYVLENHEVIKHVYCKKYFRQLNTSAITH